MYDYLIKNGLVVDGSGKPAVKADVAVKGDKVARIAPDIQEPAAEVYDAAGKYVIPGLIDPHVHEEWYCFDDGRYESYIRQGVTTLVNGNCSHSITSSSIGAKNLPVRPAPMIITRSIFS